MDGMQMALPMLGIVAGAAVTFNVVSFAQIREKYSTVDTDECTNESICCDENRNLSRIWRIRKRIEEGSSHPLAPNRGVPEGKPKSNQSLIISSFSWTKTTTKDLKKYTRLLLNIYSLPMALVGCTSYSNLSYVWYTHLSLS